MYHQFCEDTLRVMRNALESHCKEHPKDEELAYAAHKWILQEIDNHRRQRRLFHKSEIGHFNHELVEQPGEVRSSPWAEYSRPQ